MKLYMGVKLRFESLKPLSPEGRQTDMLKLFNFFLYKRSVQKIGLPGNIRECPVEKKGHTAD